MLRILFLVPVLVAALALSATEALAEPSQPCPVAYEDEPGWNWVLCGNGKRGVVTMNGTPRVVGAIRFARLYCNGNLDRSHRSQRMRGDRTALAFHPCN